MRARVDEATCGRKDVVRGRVADARAKMEYGTAGTAFRPWVQLGATVADMGHRREQLLRTVMVASLFLSVGSIIAAMNWHGTWQSFALAGAEQSPPTTSLIAVEAQATFQQWVIVALIGLAAGVVASVVLLARATHKESDQTRTIEA